MSEFDPGRTDQQDLYAAELNRLVRRLRGLSGGAWRTRRAVVLDAIRALAELAAEVSDDAPHALPEIPDHAMADALAVVGADLVDVAAGGAVYSVLGRGLSTVRAAYVATS